MSSNSSKTCCQSCLRRHAFGFNKPTRINTIKARKHFIKQLRLLVRKEMAKSAFTGRSVTLMKYRIRLLVMLDRKRLSVGGLKMKNWDPCCSSRSRVTVAIAQPTLLKTDRETYSSIRIHLARKTHQRATTQTTQEITLNPTRTKKGQLASRAHKTHIIEDLGFQLMRRLRRTRKSFKLRM